MREFIYYSKNAVTAGNFIKDNLMKAGRMDIVCNVLIQSFFISNQIRKDLRLHMVFDGPPFGARHLIFDFSDVDEEEIMISKKDIAGLIKRMLYKCPKESGKISEVFPGCFIEIKSLENLAIELKKSGKIIYLLDEKGDDIRNIKNYGGNEVFIFGDHDGFPKDKKKFLKNFDKIAVSPKILFSSQVAVILNNEIDRKKEEQISAIE